MKVVSIYSLKGGTGKSITAANLAYILAVEHKQRVLLVDFDEQGNSSQYFAKFHPDKVSSADVLARNCEIAAAIIDTGYSGLHIMTANSNLYGADRLLFKSRDANRLKEQLDLVADQYDFCIIDNAPRLSMPAVNALTASEYVIVPMRSDNFSLEGIKELKKQISNAKNLNPKLKMLGCLVTHYQNNDVNNQCIALLKERLKLPVLDTYIWFNTKISESTFYSKPLLEVSRRSGAAVQYKKLAAEVLEALEEQSDSDIKEGAKNGI